MISFCKPLAVFLDTLHTTIQSTLTEGQLNAVRILGKVMEALHHSKRISLILAGFRMHIQLLLNLLPSSSLPSCTLDIISLSFRGHVQSA